MDNKNIAIWGLSYKENSDTLRRSLAVEIGNQLISKKANLSLFDPLIDKLPKGWNNDIKIYSSPISTIRNTDIIIVCTYSMLYENITNKHFTNNKKKIVILDQNTHLRKIRNSKKIEYFTVGSN